jgi:hypothetical protein
MAPELVADHRPPVHRQNRKVACGPAFSLHKFVFTWPCAGRCYMGDPREEQSVKYLPTGAGGAYGRPIETGTVSGVKTAVSLSRTQ